MRVEKCRTLSCDRLTGWRSASAAYRPARRGRRTFIVAPMSAPEAVATDAKLGEDPWWRYGRLCRAPSYPRSVIKGSNSDDFIVLDSSSSARVDVQGWER